MTKLSSKASKDKFKNGSGSLFSAYLANMNMPLGTMAKGSKREKISKVNFETIFSKDIPIPDSMTAELLIRYIATEHQWHDDQTRSDISILINNRLSTVKDLRVLSKESWKQLELLPFTKDLLREAINRGKLSTEEEYLKKKDRLEKRKGRRLSRETVTTSISSTIEILDNTNRNSITINRTDTKNFKKEVMDPISPSSNDELSNNLEVTKYPIHSSPQSQLQRSPIVPPKDFHHINYENINNDVKNGLLIDTNKKIATKTTTKTTTKTITTISDPVSKLEDVKRFMPEPNKMLVGEDRLKIRADDGKFYEIDRYCPHAGSDLFSRGAIVGSKLICSKHRWIFSLEDGGNCLSGGKGSINACLVNNW
ncbi:8495_t:CDS:2 [Entrophospora sp. SA101]|nr:6528_t:CDS:2 [Entrophospora sp. SA101]CAJ0630341.1 8398_t:CDS:2 [Entrophospora sp. SA101]CAJ0760476.1 8495_t:CDS:2 [Entrophospora sp. SA101]CAJ0907631.1 6525_t:CDS:2 [Entrophospora sp. SA101]